MAHRASDLWLGTQTGAGCHRTIRRFAADHVFMYTKEKKIIFSLTTFLLIRFSREKFYVKLFSRQISY